MPVRRLLAAATTPLALLGAAAPAAAQVLAQPAAGGGALTPGRFWSLVGGALAIAGVVAGALALARSAGLVGTRRRAAVVAVVAGLAGGAIGAAVVAAAEGGPNTGYGIVGGFIALGIGVVAVVLGGLALLRSRRSPLPG